jgi:hypothetical protein
MSIVTAQRVNDYLSNPFWTETQWDEAARLCAEREDDLAERLSTPIEPIGWTETAAVLDTGLVATTYPVFAVTEFEGAAVDDDHPLPTGWRLVRHRVRADVGSAVSVPVTWSSYGTLWPRPSGAASRIQSVGQVNIAYQAGWGEIPALVNAVVRKVAAIMKNRHDDTLVTDDAGSASGRQVPTVTEEWTADELAGLGAFRNPRGLAWR